MSRTTSDEFSSAVEASRHFTIMPSQDDLLTYYALYKQATQNPPFADSSTPGMFDLKGKAKRKAWEKVKDMDPEEAEREYIAAIESGKITYRYDADKVPETVGK